MLHAELHHKFTLETLGFERSEDILTSTVFGILLMAEGGQPVLRAWLRKARLRPSDQPLDVPSVPAQHRFWPQLEGCTPDLALRFGDLACVIEAKYLSGASDIAREGIPEPERQLQTQWKACAAGARLMSTFSEAQRFQDTVLLYVVDGVRGARASRDAVNRARACDGSSRIGLLFWQDLHVTLVELIEGGTNAPPWVEELAQLLASRQLGTFSGFSNQIDPDAALRSALLVSTWRHVPAGFQASLAAVMPHLAGFHEELQDWRRAE